VQKLQAQVATRAGAVESHRRIGIAVGLITVPPPVDGEVAFGVLRHASMTSKRKRHAIREGGLGLSPAPVWRVGKPARRLSATRLFGDPSGYTLFMPPRKKTSTASTAHAQHPAFSASKKLADSLQRVLVDLIDLHVQGKQAHWNVGGHNFRDLHLQLDEIILAAREFSDEVAERMRALYITPDGRSATVAATTSLTPFPSGEVDTSATVDLATQRLYAVVGTIRAVHDDVDDEDPTSADILHGVIERLEQLAWMVSAENRIANTTTPTPVAE